AVGCIARGTVPGGIRSLQQREDLVALGVLVDQGLRQPLRHIRRLVHIGGSQASVSVRGPDSSRRTQVARRPISSQVPSMICPPGLSPAIIIRQAASTSETSYWRSTLKARTTSARWPASSKPPRANPTPSWGGSTREGS